MVVRGADPSMGERFFKKFIEFGHVKLKNKSIFINFMIFCEDLDRNIINPTLANFYEFPLNFPLAILIYSLKFAGWPPRHKLIIQYLEYEGVRGRSPELKRKLKSFYRKIGLFPADFKGI